MAEITRRAVMAGMGAVAAAAGVTAARAAVPLDADMTGPLVPNDDAELFDLWQERQSEVADWEAICEREPPNGPRNPEYRAWLAESMGAGRLVAEIEREIADTPAQGYAGLLIKARLAVELVDADDSDPYALNALALLADLERLAGEARS